MEKRGCVYIISSGKCGTIYIGVTSDLVKRIYEHKNGLAEGFSKEHVVKNLVYFEIFDDMENAITREKQMKKWKRDWKLRLIEEKNPNWEDLYPSLL